MKFAYLVTSYANKRVEIENRLNEFRAVKNKSEKEIFAELVFCILTPQSKARACDTAVKSLFESNIIFLGTKRNIERLLKSRVRFHKTKAGHIIKARDLLANGIKDKLAGNSMQVREWLVENIDGLGYKEASHFLRNIGLGEELAILDRHVLKNLVKHGVIKEVPKTLIRKRYMEIEERMKDFAEKLEIPIAHLDLLFWCQETGEIFK